MIAQIYKSFRGKVSFRLKLDWGAMLEKRRKWKRSVCFPRDRPFLCKKTLLLWRELGHGVLTPEAAALPSVLTLECHQTVV